jgi:hypothetical protein
MSKGISCRLVAVPLIVAVIVLSFQIVAHYDGNDHDEAHCTCQVCHIAHAAIPQPAAQARMQAPLRITRFAPLEVAASSVESASILSIPRAPPA